MKRAIHHPLHGGNLVWASSLANCSPSAILDFSASINPLGPPQSAIATIQEHLGDLKAYPDPQYQQLRAALSQFHQVPAEWILPGNGSAELLTWACRDLSALDNVWVITPAFGDYLRALKAFEAKIMTWALSDFRAPTEQLEALIQPSKLNHLKLNMQHSSRGLLLNNPHNPTGLLFNQASVQACLEHFSLLVVDEAFMDFLPPDKQQSVIDAVLTHSNLVILRSLTKFYSLPGLRLGYAIAHPDRLQRWQQWRDPWSVNALAAAVGEVVIDDNEFQQQTWDWLATAKPKLYQGLATLPGLTPLSGAANFLLVESEYSVVELQAELLKRHQILIRDCLSFSELGDRYFRVAVRTEGENQRLLTGLAEILGNRA
ncbi:MAG: threonine-phosphate decarboxylase CobD [Kovacikia sp.]